MTKTIRMSSWTCSLCGESLLDEVTAFFCLPRVTSDIRPWPTGGRLAVCGSCGAVQKIADETWFSEIGAIYGGYDMYHQSAGVEQAVFDPDNGQPVMRSDRLLDRLSRSIALPDRGRILDIGSGTGAMLAAVARKYPDWELYGQDLNDRFLPRLRMLPGFQTLFNAELDAIAERFDLVTMIHSLEHFPDPRAALRAAAALVRPGGYVFIQVPDVRTSPFDLIVADHKTHFSAVTLENISRQCKLHPIVLTDGWVAKELSLVAHLSDEVGLLGRGNIDQNALERTSEQVSWLNSLAVLARAETGTPFIFGTAIGATWLSSCLDGRVEAFVDEDPSRIGKKHMGRPVLAPGDLCPGARVLTPLAPVVAETVIRRLAALPVHFICSS